MIWNFFPKTSTTGTPVSQDFIRYTDTAHNFMISYPKDATVRNTNDPKDVLSYDLPKVPGTNLHEKYFTVSTEPATSACITQSFEEVTEIKKVTSLGVDFLKQETAGAGAGNFYETISYSTIRNNLCYRLQFVLHSVNAQNYDNPPPLFDHALESKVFDQIFATFVTTQARQSIQSDTASYTNTVYHFSLSYPSKYAMKAGGDRYLVTFAYLDPTKSPSTEEDHIHVSVLQAHGAKTFEEYLAKYPVLGEESGIPIPFSKFKSVSLGGKTFYSIVGERFEGMFGTKYFYFTPKTVYLFESHSYIGTAWTDPKFDEANEPVHKDLKQTLATLSFTQ